MPMNKINIFRYRSWTSGMVVLSVLIIVAFFAVLTGNQTRGHRYQNIEIGWGKDLLLIIALYLSVIGLVSRRIVLSFSRREVFVIFLLLLLFQWGKFGDAITGRDYQMFGFFSLMAIVGVLIGNTKHVQYVELGIIVSGIVICVSIIVLAFFSVTLGTMFLFDNEAIANPGISDRLFLMNGGILLNSNSVGSVLPTILAFYLCSITSRNNRIISSVFVIILFLTSIISGSGTAIILCFFLACYYFLSVVKSTGLYYNFIRLVVVLFLVVIPLILLLRDYSFVQYKIESGLVKTHIFVTNITDLFESSRSLIWGAGHRAVLSESTLIDFLYYYGLIGIASMLALIMMGVTRRYLYINNFGIVRRISPLPFYCVITVLLLVQNSVLLPPVSFLFGLMLTKQH